MWSLIIDSKQKMIELVTRPDPTTGVVSGGGVKNEDPGGHNLTEEERKAKLEKLQKIPGYRTKLCQNKENCEYGDLCLFAHSKGKLFLFRLMSLFHLLNDIRMKLQ